MSWLRVLEQVLRGEWSAPSTLEADKAPEAWHEGTHAVGLVANAEQDLVQTSVRREEARDTATCEAPRAGTSDE